MFTPIDEKSILHKKPVSELAKAHRELLFIVKVYDDTFAQKVQVNHSYRLADLTESAKLDLMFHTDSDGSTVLDLNKIDNIKMVNN